MALKRRLMGNVIIVARILGGILVALAILDIPQMQFLPVGLADTFRWISSVALVVGLGVPSGLRCWAADGVATATSSTIATMPTTKRMRASSTAMIILRPDGGADILALR